MQSPSLSTSPSWRRYGVAVAATLAAAALQWALRPLFGHSMPFLAFWLAIPLVAAFAGRGPALLPWAAGIASALLWLPPGSGPEPLAAADLVALVLYGAFGYGLAHYAARLRRLGERAAVARRVDTQLARTQAELQQQIDDLDRLHELSSRLPELPGLRAQLETIAGALARFHGTPLALLSLLDRAESALRVEAVVGFDAPLRALLDAVPPDRGACAEACTRRERVVVVDTEDSPLADPALGAPPTLRELGRRAGFRAVHCTPLLGQHGDVLGVLSVFLAAARAPTEREKALADICARKAAVFVERARAESALADAQGRYQAVLEASAVPFVVLAPQRDAAGEIVDFVWTYLNGAAAKSLGHAVPELLGRRVLDVLPPQWRHGVAFEHYADVARTGETREFEVRSLLGAERWVHCVASAMRGDVAVWFTDISERKRSERLLREADRRKDEFLATLAHELRNPLAPIRQAALLSTAPGASEAQKRWSQEVIERQVRQMALLLDDLLDVSRITRGALPLRRSRTDLAAVVAGAVETARPVIDAMGHDLAVDVPAEPVAFEADALRVSQVVANLLTNAAKYTERGGHIRVHARRESAEVVIDVADDGIGIPPEAQPEVFRMFARPHVPAGYDSAGLGIGLALSKGLVELHGGTIAVASAGSGCGSTFTVRLPIGRTAPPATASAPAAGGRAAVPRRVLIADDNRDAADSLAQLLQLEGHETALSFDGEAALATYERFAPDVCLLDIGMPGRNGYELARAIRQRPGGDKPVLVAITGWGQDSDRTRALQAGFDHHLTKPVDPARLTELFD